MFCRRVETWSTFSATDTNTFRVYINVKTNYSIKQINAFFTLQTYYNVRLLNLVFIRTKVGSDRKVYLIIFPRVLKMHHLLIKLHQK